MFGSGEPGKCNANEGPWSVRAEFTIQRADEPSSSSSSSSASSTSARIVPTSEPSGVRMTYTFTPAPSVALAPAAPGFGLRRGDLVFTSTPAQRSLIPVRAHTIPRSDGRTCKTTCSIVLANSQRPAFPRPWSTYQAAHPFAQIAQRAATTTTTATRVATSSRDAASQTTDIEANQSPVAQRRRLRARAPAAPSGPSARDEIKSNHIGRVSKATAGRKSPEPPRASGASSSASASDARDDSSEKRKRTVHIDVYCTGSEDDPNDEEDDDDDADDVDNDESSSLASSADVGDKLAQSTVFEDSRVRVRHTRADAGLLPRGFQDENAFLKRASERRCESFRHAPVRMPSLASSKGYESDDVLSSLYPSQFSSYSRLRDFESSVPWSAASSRSGLAVDEYDSASATSCKDTVSDLESLVRGRGGVTPCDSFEYADSVDQERIRRMEAMWSKGTAHGRILKSKNWRSPQVERKHLLQGKMMKDYMERHPPVGWSSDSSDATSDSNEEEEEEVGWSFVSSEENTSVVSGKLTLGDAAVATEKSDRAPSRLVQSTSESPSQRDQLIGQVKTTIFRDRIGPFGSVSSSPPLSKLQSRVTSPFTTPQGEKTDHILKASIFGRVVNTFRKPGHHVGPAKNPACSCEHCRRHFEESARRRSRSFDPVERKNCSRAPSVTN